MKVALRPRIRLDVVKVLPKSICAVPTKYFEFPFGFILIDLETKTASKNEVGFTCVFGIEFGAKIEGF